MLLHHFVQKPTFEWTFLFEKCYAGIEQSLEDGVKKNASFNVEYFADGAQFVVERSPSIDFVITLGGDGTILNVSFMFQSTVPPILSFNFGSLGFLTYFAFENYAETLDLLLENKLPTLQRTRIHCKLHKADGGTMPAAECHVLNEMTIERGPNSNMVMIDAHQNNAYLTTIHADGVIVATPTGSTAYSLSAGGCLVHPAVASVIVTPICPHTLSFRPMVLPAMLRLRLSVAAASRSTAWITCDSRSKMELGRGDVLEIASSAHDVPCFVPPGANHASNDEWFNSLSRCLAWNVKTNYSNASSPFYAQ